MSPFATNAIGELIDGDWDMTARIQRKAFREATERLDPDVCLWWNATAWVLEPSVDRAPSKGEDGELGRGPGAVVHLEEAREEQKREGRSCD